MSAGIDPKLVGLVLNKRNDGLSLIPFILKASVGWLGVVCY